MKKMKRSAAIASGLTQYFTGKPCPKGHVAMRQISGGCVECRKVKMNKYRAKNRERLLPYHREYSKKWWRKLKKDPQRLEARRKYMREARLRFEARA